MKNPFYLLFFFVFFLSCFNLYLLAHSSLLIPELESISNTLKQIIAGFMILICLITYFVIKHLFRVLFVN